MRGTFGHYLPATGVASLHKYSYASGHRTPLDEILNPWWEAVEKVVPLRVHPNILTVCSCISAILGCCLLLGFCPYLSESPPRWVFLGAAALFFLYQTLDAIDGKHARRLGLSSPLGQLMDHGCDIICTTPLTLLSTAVIGGGVGIRQYLVAVLSSQLLQFLYNVSCDARQSLRRFAAAVVLMVQAGIRLHHLSLPSVLCSCNLGATHQNACFCCTSSGGSCTSKYSTRPLESSG